MKSRGYSLKGRTAFAIYRFDGRDKSVLTAFLSCFMLIILAVFSGETEIYFDPMIFLNPVTVKSYLSYGAYGMFLLLPPVLEIAAERRWKQLMQ